MTRSTITITTDGSCYPNPGQFAGHAAILRREDGYERLVAGAMIAKPGDVTNQIAELQALLSGLQALKRSCHIKVITDSEMLIGWLDIHPKYGKRCEIRNAGIERMCNAIREELENHTIEYVWRRGHAGHLDNERCDRIAALCRMLAYSSNESRIFDANDMVWWTPEDKKGLGKYEIRSVYPSPESEYIGTIEEISRQDIDLGKIVYLDPPKIMRKKKRGKA